MSTACILFRKAEEANAIRGEPLGLDRRYNKYWRFVDTEDCTGDPLAGTLVMECHEDGSFRSAPYFLLAIGDGKPIYWQNGVCHLVSSDARA